MSGLNKVQIIGRLGRDPEMKYAQSGTAICSLNVATSETWNDKNTGGKQEKTEWHRVIAFGKQAEILEKYLKKGDQTYIEGRLQTRQYEKDGQTHYSTEIVVSNFVFLGGGAQQSQKPRATQQQPAPQQNQNTPQGYDDGGQIPF